MQTAVSSISSITRLTKIELMEETIAQPNLFIVVAIIFEVIVAEYEVWKC